MDDEFALEHGEEMDGLFLGMRGREGKGMQEVEKKRVSEGQTEHQSNTLLTCCETRICVVPLYSSPIFIASVAAAAFSETEQLRPARGERERGRGSE